MTDLQKRVEELKEALDQSAANHNALLGRFHEAQYLLSLADKKEESADEKGSEVVDS